MRQNLAVDIRVGYLLNQQQTMVDLRCHSCDAFCDDYDFAATGKYMKISK